MEQITFHCKVITPMFLAGADGRTPELRAPSIKGAMRFWWRAMNGHLGVEELRRREGQVFGDTVNGKSKVVIRVVSPPALEKQKFSPTPHDIKFVKEAIKPGTSFIVNLNLTTAITFEDGTTFSIKDLEELFFLLTTLGGIGGRVRRGFGVFQIVRVEGSSVRTTQPTNVSEIFSLLPGNPFELKEDHVVSNFAGGCEYPCIKKIEIGKPRNDWESLLFDIGQSSSKSKSDNNNNWDYKNSLGHASPRYSSPVYVSVINVQEQFLPVITTLEIVLDGNESAPMKSNQIQKEFKDRIL